ncbi:MAG: type transport system ATP-binding protein [Actinomycetota bacterium]|jgi:ABC-2 type transport system ATP-binding protein|nr:type transport system ATP-binding protein [Actinomycetota bacterium]
MTAIQVRGLRKSYGAIEAVRGIDLDVEEGEVFGLLGPNGAGKTTTVEILEGYRPRSAGEVTVLGHDPAQAHRDLKERIGIVLQETGVERYLNVTEVVDLYRGYYRKSRPTAELLALTGLEAQKDQRVKTLSGGQKRRLDLALALAGDPELLFLDEPTTGFDPTARRGAWDVIKGLRELGTTILLTTHYMDEAQVLADRVAVIVGGVIVAEGPPDNLAGGERATEIHFTLPPGTGADALPELTPPATVRVEGGAVLVTVPDPTQALNTLTGWALGRGLTLPDLTVTRPRLEDVYLELTKEVTPPVSDPA